MSQHNLGRPAQAAVPTIHISHHDEAETTSSTAAVESYESSFNSGAVAVRQPSVEELKSPESNELNLSAVLVLSAILGKILLDPFRALYTKYQKYKAERAKELIGEKKRLQDLYANLRTGRPPIKEFPPGWPQLAAFHYSEENLAVFRRFGLTRCRLLVQLEAEIQQLETKLFKLDWSDAPDDAPNHYRLNMIDFEEGWDSAQVDLRRQLEKKFLVYDQLLLNEQKLREIEPASRNDHLSVYHWIHRRKPLAKQQYDWINHPVDCISLSKIDQFECSIFSSCLKRLFRKSVPGQDSIVDHYSSKGIATFAKLLNVLMGVAILAIPMFVLLWVPETKAWISATVLLSIIGFSTLMTLLTRAKGQEILIGTVAYCAVLATFLGNTHSNQGPKPGG